MKKKLLAAIPLVALGGAAFAQSSVTLFGTVDQAATYINGSDNWSGLQSGGNMDSRIGFRGTEDLGAGLKAQFWLESGILADTGSGDSGGGLDFKRRATVGLLGNFGEIRLGRDESAAYRTMKNFDVFNNAGIGGARMWDNNLPVLAPLDYDSRRKDNSISYYSPNWGGFNFGVNYGFGERPTDTWENGSYWGASLGYDNGPWSAALTAEQQNNILVPLPGAPADVGFKDRAYSVGLGYDFGRMKVSGAYRQNRVESDTTDRLKGNSYMLGVAAPVGAVGVVKASYNRYEREVDAAGTELKADHFSLGYEHNLSKRTALYGTYSYLKNKEGAAPGNLSLGGIPVDEDGKQHGIQLGVRHSF